MGDGLLILAGIVFLFIVWVWTGGPSRPISFAGPFITPITTTGDVQTGYGEDIGTPEVGTSGGSYWSLKSVLGSYENSAPGGSAPAGNRSTFSGRVTITSGISGPSLADEDREYVSLRNASGSGMVDISGWTITGKNGSAYIPRAAEIARYEGGGSLKDIVLESGGEAVIYTGKSPAGGDSYRETSCTRYLDTRRAYDDCVDDHRNDNYFLSDTWLIYLNRSRELWGNNHETITLLDSQGRVVDQYSY
jgi:hypothetical protein